MKNLKKEVKRKAALFVALAVIVTSAPPEYLTVYAAETNETSKTSEPEESAQQKSTQHETDAPEIRETETEEPKTEKPVADLPEAETEKPVSETPEEETEKPVPETPEVETKETETKEPETKEEPASEEPETQETSEDNTVEAETDNIQTETEEIAPEADGAGISWDGHGYSEDISWTIDYDGELLISGSGEIVRGRYYSAPWYDHRNDIKSVRIDGNITGVTTTSEMFKDCYNLQKVNLSGLDLSQVTDMSYMFYDCESLTSLDASNFNTQKVTDMSSMFDDCRNLASLDVSKFDTQNVTNMKAMFLNCRKLTSLDVSNFNTQNVTDMASMFYDCESLTSLDVSKFDTQNVTNMEAMFSDCESLTSLDVSNFNTEKVKNITYMFRSCSSLTTLDLGQFSFQSAQSFYDMLYDCTGLKEIKNPAGLKIAIELPATDGACSWRGSDGKKINDNKLLRNLTESMTISTDKYFGISIQGDQNALFKLTDEKYQDKTFTTTTAEELEVVEKGAKTPYTFTIVADEGYIIKSVAPKAGDKSKIKIIKGEQPDQYIVMPIDENEGYTRDEIINVTTVPISEYELYIHCDYYSGENIESVIVVNGESKTEKEGGKDNGFTVNVSNKYDTTIYVKAKKEDKDTILVPKLRYNDYYNSASISREQDAASMSAEEKEYAEKGYSIFRMGRLSERASVEVSTTNAYRLKFTAEGFPGEVHIYECTENKSDDTQSTQPREYTIGEEYTVESNTFYIQIKWTDTPEATCKWCRPKVYYKYGEDNMNLQEPTTLSGVDGDVWQISPFRHMEVAVLLTAHTIELANYDESAILDLTIDNQSAYLDEYEAEEFNTSSGRYEKVIKRCLAIFGGDSLTLTFRLDNGIEPDWSTDSNLTYAQSEDGKYTISVNNMSNLWNINSIDMNIRDTKNRTPLSAADCTITSIKYRINNSTVSQPYYTGEAIEPYSMTVKATVQNYNGYNKPRTLALKKDKDYTIRCENNINAGEALLFITAMPDNLYFRGTYVYPFTIDKALAPKGQYKTIQIENKDQQYTHQINLAEQFKIELADGKALTPTGYKLVTPCDKGEVLVQNEEPAIEGNILTFKIRDDANKHSQVASLTIYATFDNYKDCELRVGLQVVKKQKLTLGGTVIITDKEYDGKDVVPNIDGLQIPSVEGADGAASPELLKEIKNSLTFHYTGVEGTIYDSDNSPLDIGTYKVQVKVSEENLDYKSDYMDVGTFKITQRNIKVIADDVKLYLDDTIPTQYTYHTEGMAEGDTVSTMSFVTCGIQTTDHVAEYPVTVNVSAVKIANPAKKDVTANYIITGQEGKLTVNEPEPGSCIVTYTRLDPRDPQNPKKDMRRSGYEAGKLIERPVNPTADGYVFLGWFTDVTMAKEWNFATDIIMGDVTLYACWSKCAAENGGLVLCVQDIVPQNYTGSAVKPTVIVYAADGKTRLKLNTDYTVTYKNNVNADTKNYAPDKIPTGGTGESLDDTSQGFDSSLPYVIVKGKKNYKGAVYVNFHINPADISEAERAGSGYAFKYVDQFEENASKSAAIVTQFKYKSKGLKYAVDYTLEVMKEDSAGGEPTSVTLNDKGQLWKAAGVYQLTITGTGNYKGSISKKLYVADKTKLLKNAKVSCKSTISNVTKGQLAAGIEPENLVVKLNNAELAKDTQYKVTCIGNHAVGTATVTITPAEGSGLLGSRSITFKIKGTGFNAGVQQFKPADMTYTGKALTQNDIKLIAKEDGKELVYGEDYTVSYRNNIKKGTAKMIFTANPSSGYSGSINKNFKITPMNLGMALEGESPEILITGAQKDSRWKLTESIPYQKGGTTAADKISLELKSTGAILTAGNKKDYTVSYKNNKEVSNGAAYMTLKGTGNYTGSVDIYFDISKASLSELREEGRVKITSESIRVSFSYTKDEDGEDDELKDAGREFKPAVTIKDGKTTLKKGTDYTIIGYSGNTRSALADDNSMTVTIKGIGNYGGVDGDEGEIEETITVNRRTINSNNVKITCGKEFTYTGEPITPSISVERKSGTYKEPIEDDDGEPVLDENGQPKYKTITEWEDISEGTDYRIEYSKNIAQGTGTIKIIGINGYSGSASKSFKITPKPIYNQPGQSSEPEPDDE